jgi:fumarylacetoacetate (FAA) hydrolase family protein
MKLTKNRILQVFACALMVFAVSCQSAQTKQAAESLKKKQNLAGENSALSAKANSLRKQISDAQYQGDYLSAKEIRKELNEVVNKMEQNKYVPQKTNANYSTEAGSGYYTGGIKLGSQTNGTSSYVSSGQDTTSSRMLRTAK